MTDGTIAERMVPPRVDPHEWASVAVACGGRLVAETGTWSIWAWEDGSAALHLGGRQAEVARWIGRAGGVDVWRAGPWVATVTHGTVAIATAATVRRMAALYAEAARAELS